MLYSLFQVAFSLNHVLKPCTQNIITLYWQTIINLSKYLKILELFLILDVSNSAVLTIFHILTWALNSFMTVTLS